MFFLCKDNDSILDKQERLVIIRENREIKDERGCFGNQFRGLSVAQKNGMQKKNELQRCNSL